MTPQDTIRNYEKALASQDWKKVEPLLHEGVCVTFSTGTFKGKHDVKAAFETNFKLIKDEEYSISDLYWVFIGTESASCMYNFHWRGVIDGQEMSGGGRGTSVLIKVGETWQIAVEHLGPFAA